MIDGGKWLSTLVYECNDWDKVIMDEVEAMW